MSWTPPWVAKHPDVYEPSDDTFLLAKTVEEHVVPGTRFLEVGCGTGLVSLTAARAGAQVTCTDANPHAVALTRANAKEHHAALEVHETDLLEGLEGPFDLVAFNPPYLPTGPDDVVEGPLNLAFDGGPDGNAVALRFANQLCLLPSLPATVLVIHSSLSHPEPLIKRMEDAGYKHDEAAFQRLPYETLWVRRFRL